MLEALKKRWRSFKSSAPGKRFQLVYHERQKRRDEPWKKWVAAGLGGILCLTGLFLLPAPGPGSLVLIGGLALIAGESLVTARFLDWSEVRLRKLVRWAMKRWRRMSVAAKAAGVTVVVLVTLGLATGAWLWWRS